MVQYNKGVEPLGLSLFVVILVATSFKLVSAHVALTYPPARKYDLDFLDNSRTNEPCGMYKGTTVTEVSAGEKLNVTWHLGYAHKGGIKIELLDRKGNHYQDLTPAQSGGWIGADDKYLQSWELDIPDGLTCPNCTLRLLRQAKEWTVRGGEYLFKSCADVNIVPYADRIISREKLCSGHGKVRNGRTCKCDRLYYGSYCQYENDCEGDEDCNNKGRCIQSEGTSIPNKECYCQPGFYGQTCEKQSVLKEKKYDPADYNEMKLRGEKFKFLWRFVGDGNGDEIEGVIVAKTSSYVAIGWRPEGIKTQCRSFPDDAPPPINPGNPLHGMDCQDIIVAKVKGDGSNIGDYYTRDRSTPRRDSFYGGHNDLTAAIGWEEDGMTTVMFRKPATGSQDSGKQDHNFDGKLTLIWAFGQSNTPFYKDDELKFHGRNFGRSTIETEDETMSQPRIIMIAAICLIGFILIVQAIHNLANGACKPKRKETMKDLGMENIGYNTYQR